MDTFTAEAGVGVVATLHTRCVLDSMAYVQGARNWPKGYYQTSILLGQEGGGRRVALAALLKLHILHTGRCPHGGSKHVVKGRATSRRLEPLPSVNAYRRLGGAIDPAPLSESTGTSYEAHSTAVGGVHSSRGRDRVWVVPDFPELGASAVHMGHIMQSGKGGAVTG